jgi:hypothetical protein
MLRFTHLLFLSFPPHSHQSTILSTTAHSYIGAVEKITDTMVVYDEGSGFVTREIGYVPGLFKIFDEILGKCGVPVWCGPLVLGGGCHKKSGQHRHNL